ncbi:hypothetical protein BDZ89DRAFT_1009191 [Hymenopellis radicata]|nr:hypothetical protein BDZ89DRAFT_1009191 [Hymenopellis radicata]
MGHHLLRAKRGLGPDTDTGVVVSQDYPCGFCGQSTVTGTCKLKIVGGFTSCECAYTYRLQIKAASRVSASKPCTNVPVVCVISGCGETHWKYNMPRHLNDRHPSWDKNLSEAALQSFVSKITISRAEEVAVGIPEDQIGKDVERTRIPRGEKRQDLPLTPARARHWKSAKTSMSTNATDSNQDGNSDVFG